MHDNDNDYDYAIDTYPIHACAEDCVVQKKIWLSYICVKFQLNVQSDRVNRTGYGGPHHAAALHIAFLRLQPCFRLGIAQTIAKY